MTRRVDRRRFLAAVSAGSLLGVAGCASVQSRPDTTPSEPTEPQVSSDTATPPATDVGTTASPGPGTSETPASPGDQQDAGGDPTATPTPSPTATPRHDLGPRDHPVQYRTRIDHPATMQLGKEPTIGKPPGQTETLVVQFTDISCQHCARFDAQTFPILYANYIRPGRMTFVSRDFPHVAEWTYPATYALDAVYARDHDAYWALKSRYYAHMHDYTIDNIYRETAEFLATETSVDPRPVVAEMQSETWKPAAQRDLRTKDATGVQVTPTFFLFREGRFVTRLRGNQNVRVFKSALGL